MIYIIEQERFCFSEILHQSIDSLSHYLQLSGKLPLSEPSAVVMCEFSASHLRDVFLSMWFLFEFLVMTQFLSARHILGSQLRNPGPSICETWFLLTFSGMHMFSASPWFFLFRDCKFTLFKGVFNREYIPKTVKSGFQWFQEPP